MPSCGCTIRNLGGGNVSHWMYLQLLHFSSGALEENAFWSSNHTSNGCRIDRPYLEYSRAGMVQSCSCTMGSSSPTQTETVTRLPEKTCQRQADSTKTT